MGFRAPSNSISLPLSLDGAERRSPSLGWDDQERRNGDATHRLALPDSQSAETPLMPPECCGVPYRRVRGAARACRLHPIFFIVSLRRPTSCPEALCANGLYRALARGCRVGKGGMRFGRQDISP